MSSNQGDSNGNGSAFGHKNGVNGHNRGTLEAHSMALDVLAEAFGEQTAAMLLSLDELKAAHLREQQIMQEMQAALQGAMDQLRSLY